MKLMLSDLKPQQLLQNDDFGQFMTILKVFVSQLIFDTSFNV